MPSPSMVLKRSLRICYWNAERRIVANDVLNLEHHLRQLGDVKVETLTALDDPAFAPCDLLIVAAHNVADEDFPKWLSGLRGRMRKQNQIWTPVLILAEVPFLILSDLLHEAATDNWYFDILFPAHMQSLPIRVANLLRAHDHLHELGRYSHVLEELSAKVARLEHELLAVKKGAVLQTDDKAKSNS